MEARETMTPEEWAEEYRRCWEEADADGVREIFAPDASYRSDIFAELIVAETESRPTGDP